MISLFKTLYQFKMLPSLVLGANVARIDAANPDLPGLNFVVRRGERYTLVDVYLTVCVTGPGGRGTVKRVSTCVRLVNY